MTGRKIAIIGAGPSGLVSAKYAQEYGLEVILFEKTRDLGGVWQPETGLTWENMRTNLSRFTCMFSDLPWGTSADIFPTQRQMYEYLQNYADHFNLNDCIKFQSPVVNLKKNDADWDLTWEKEGKKTTEQFDYVIIASGIFSDAFNPYNANDFKGTKLHSKDYKKPNAFKDQTVVVIGNGFSGTEIASDLSKTAAKIYHIFNNAHWILPREIPSNSSKNAPLSPLDLVFYNRSNRKKEGEIKLKSEEDNKKANTYMHGLCLKQEKVSTELKIAPEEWNKPSFVSISDTYLDDVKNKKIIPLKKSIKKFNERSIELDDGDIIQADAILFSTGYKLNLSFLDDKIRKELNFDPEDQFQPLELYKCTLHPAFPTLAFAGVYRGPYWAVMELQARLATAVFAGKVALPTEAAFKTALEDERLIKTTTPRGQFPHGDYLGLADDIAKELGCLPNFEMLKTEFPELYKLLYEGPLLLSHYCFFKENNLINDYTSSVSQLMDVKNFLEERNKQAISKKENEGSLKNESILWTYNNKEGSSLPPVIPDKEASIKVEPSSLRRSLS